VKVTLTTYHQNLYNLDPELHLDQMSMKLVNVIIDQFKGLALKVNNQNCSILASGT